MAESLASFHQKVDMRTAPCLSLKLVEGQLMNTPRLKMIICIHNNKTHFVQKNLKNFTYKISFLTFFKPG